MPPSGPEFGGMPGTPDGGICEVDEPDDPEDGLL
jgi:hypothetical protein